MHEYAILPWAALASIAAAVLQAGMLLQRIKADELRIGALERQVRALEMWQQRQRGRQDAAMQGRPASAAESSSLP